VLHSAGFKREQSRQRSKRITQTKSTTGKVKKAWDMQTEVGERERERERERESTWFWALGGWRLFCCLPWQLRQ
jgi:hypothetical protein